MPSQITPLPTAPNRSRPSTFSSEADEFLAALPPFVSEANTLATEMYTNASAVYLALAQTSEEVLVSTATLWEAGDYTVGDMVWSPSNALTYRAKNTFTSSVDPANDLVNWVSFSNRVFLSEQRSSDAVFTISDSGKEIQATGDYTQTFSSAASLGNGWWIMIQCVSGRVTLDPDGAELIDGLSSILMLPNETRLIRSNGSTLSTRVLSGFLVDVPVTESFTISGYNQIGVYLVSGSGGGGSGAVSDNTYCLGGAGGGGGGMYFGSEFVSSASTTISIAVGAGGVGGAAVETDDTLGNIGTSGGSTTLDINGVRRVTVTGGTADLIPAPITPVSSYGVTLGGGVGPMQGGTYGLSHMFSPGYPRQQSYCGGSASGYMASLGYYYSASDSIYGGGGGGWGGSIVNGSYAGANRGTSTYGGDGGASSPFSATTNGGDGQDGEAILGAPGGGGGGGAAAKNGYSSGKGGNGCPGYARIWGIV
jgi:hypothetical protein